MKAAMISLAVPTAAPLAGGGETVPNIDDVHFSLFERREKRPETKGCYQGGVGPSLGQTREGVSIHVGTDHA